MNRTSLRLFDGYGIEVEYMIVHRDTLKVLPVTDWLLREVSGDYNNEVEMGDLEWSNELVMHVVELKTHGAAPSLHNLHEPFMKDIARINALLEKTGGMLLPGGMHPLMDPSRETVLWKHDNSPIYEKYNAIFDCSGHGWSNLQSVHINLPFGDDGEFGRLHAATRLVLPLIPAIAASSPLVEGRVAGPVDYRLEVYRNNQKKIPEIAGDVIPEPVFSRKEYEDVIFSRIFRAIAPYDPEGTLQYEWLNSRGCIARFERNAIEIRLMDVQECPVMDMAVVSFITAVIRALVNGEVVPQPVQRSAPTEMLGEALLKAVRDGGRAKCPEEYSRLFGMSRQGCSFSEVMRYLKELEPVKRWISPEHMERIAFIMDHGTLAERIIAALRGDMTTENIITVYRRLAACLNHGETFLP